MSHAAAAAGEYRRMMEEKSRAECPTQATDGAAENAPQAWAAGTDASTPNDAGTTPKITADDVYDHFKDCEEEEEEVGALILFLAVSSNPLIHSMPVFATLNLGFSPGGLARTCNRKGGRGGRGGAGVVPSGKGTDGGHAVCARRGVVPSRCSRPYAGNEDPGHPLDYCEPATEHAVSASEEMCGCASIPIEAHLGTHMETHIRRCTYTDKQRGEEHTNTRF
jgi:hypothetical protein